jgi:hypothetical protein
LSGCAAGGTDLCNPGERDVRRGRELPGAEHGGAAEEQTEVERQAEVEE